MSRSALTFPMGCGRERSYATVCADQRTALPQMWSPVRAAYGEGVRIYLPLRLPTVCLLCRFGLGMKPPWRQRLIDWLAVHRLVWLARWIP